MEAATREGASVEERIEALLGADEDVQETDTPEVAEAEVEEVAEAVEGEDDTPDEDHEADAQEAEEERLGLDELAQYLKLEADKLDVDDAGNVYVKTKVDGQEGRATLQDLIKSYQLEGHLNKQNMEVAEQRKALQAKLAESEQQAQARLQQLETLTQLAHQELLGEYNAVNWQQLRELDPSEYAAKFTDFQQRQQRIGQMAQQLQAQRAQSEQHSAQSVRERLAEEGQKLLAAIPEWADASVAQKEKAALREYAVNSGMAAEEVDGLTSHTHVVLLRKAMLFDQLQQSRPAIEKKVKAAPKKLAVPGAVKSQQEQKQANVKALRSTIQRSGGKQGIEAYLLATGKV